MRFRFLIKYKITFLDEKHSSSYTQIELNKNESASFNKNFTKKIKEKVNKSHDINRENIKINAMDKPELIWEDENALIAYIRASTNVEGITHVEEIIASTILYNNYALYMYILQIEGSDNALNDAQLLLHAAKVTKSR